MLSQALPRAEQPAELWEQAGVGSWVVMGEAVG